MTLLAKTYYTLRLTFFVLVAGASLFWIGWHMGQHECKNKMLAALKADNTHEASRQLAHWVKVDPKYKDDPAFYTSCASIHLKNGNAVAAKYNLDKALNLMGK